MLETADQSQKYKRIKRKKMYYRVNKSVDSMPNRAKSGLIVLELLTAVYNIGNSIRELNMSIESLTFDLRHGKESKERMEEQLVI